MWILIPTLMIKGWGILITPIPGFQTEEACRYAGAQQETILRTDFQLKTDKQYTFICVQTK